MTIVPMSSGTPATAKAKKWKGGDPALAAASTTSTLTGVPVSASNDPE